MYEEIKKAYEKIWGKVSEEIIPLVSKETLADFPDIKILLFPPSRTQKTWIYATMGMSDLGAGETSSPEVHIYSEEKNDSIISAISGLMEHVQEEEIHFCDVLPCATEGSQKCTSLLAAFPFPDGEGFPEIEIDGREIEFIWLLPVTDSELKHLKKEGYDSLEEKLFASEVNFFDWNRDSVV